MHSHIRARDRFPSACRRELLPATLQKRTFLESQEQHHKSSTTHTHTWQGARLVLANGWAGVCRLAFRDIWASAASPEAVPRHSASAAYCLARRPRRAAATPRHFFLVPPLKTSIDRLSTSLFAFRPAGVYTSEASASISKHHHHHHSFRAPFLEPRQHAATDVPVIAVEDRNSLLGLPRSERERVSCSVRGDGGHHGCPVRSGREHQDEERV